MVPKKKKIGGRGGVDVFVVINKFMFKIVKKKKSTRLNLLRIWRDLE